MANGITDWTWLVCPAVDNIVEVHCSLRLVDKKNQSCWW